MNDIAIHKNITMPGSKINPITAGNHQSIFVE